MPLRTDIHVRYGRCASEPSLALLRWDTRDLGSRQHHRVLAFSLGPASSGAGATIPQGPQQYLPKLDNAGPRNLPRPRGSLPPSRLPQPVRDATGSVGVSLSASLPSSPRSLRAHLLAWRSCWARADVPTSRTPSAEPPPPQTPRSAPTSSSCASARRGPGGVRLPQVGSLVWTPRNVRPCTACLLRDRAGVMWLSIQGRPLRVDAPRERARDDKPKLAKSCPRRWAIYGSPLTQRFPTPPGTELGVQAVGPGARAVSAAGLLPARGVARGTRRPSGIFSLHSKPLGYRDRAGGARQHPTGDAGWDGCTSPSIPAPCVPPRPEQFRAFGSSDPVPAIRRRQGDRSKNRYRFGRADGGRPIPDDVVTRIDSLAFRRSAMTLPTQLLRYQPPGDRGSFGMCLAVVTGSGHRRVQLRVRATYPR